MNIEQWYAHVRGFIKSELTDKEKLANFGLGYVCEAGEGGDILKKHLFHGDSLDMVKLKKELGDAAWYWTAICIVTGIDPEEVLQANIDKLRARHKGTEFNGEAQRESKAKENEPEATTEAA